MELKRSLVAPSYEHNKFDNENMPNTSILFPKEGESVDTPKKFTNIDSEVFDCTWDGILHTVQPEETVIEPLYLVNYMAMHLARKILKREAFAKAPSDLERKAGIVRWKDPDKEKELQLKIVQSNFPETPSGEMKEEFMCETCGFKAASRVGLIAHQRKHK